MTENRSHWRGLVLAGGRSTRMGTDKAGLRWKGKSLLSHAVGILAELLGPENVLVSGQREGAVSDLIPGLGPIGGIATLAASESTLPEVWLLVIPVDMPLLEKRVLEQLVESANVKERSGCCAVHFEGYEFPMAFLCDSDSRNILSELCSEEVSPSMRSVNMFLRRLGAETIRPESGDERCFRNVNFPRDWEELERRSDEYSI